MGCNLNKRQVEVIRTPSEKPDTLQKIDTVKINAGVFVQENERVFNQIYRVGKSLGTGGFGDVRKCTHRENKNVRAVKIFRKDMIPEDQLDSGTFFQEIEILRSLDHPNIVRVYEYFEDSKRIYIVMELCQGGELFNRIIKKSYFSENQAAVIMRQLFSAVSYLHGKGIIHRDLKPENILLEDDDNTFNIKVIDFGAATFFNRNKQVTGKLGTAYYVAPEVLVGSYNEKCDVWSCGVIMYILLSGRPPFDGDNTRAILDKVSTKQFSLTGDVWNVVSKDSKALISAIFIPAERRISALDAYSHKWIVDYANEGQPGADLIVNVLSSLKGFHSHTKLKDAVLTFLTAQSLSNQDTKKLREVFRSIDTNGDGKLSREELLTKYKETMGEHEAEEEVNRIMREVDTDDSGFIDYTEFLKASIDQQKLLSKANLSNAFSLFDKDGSGSISAGEIRKVLEGGSMMDDEVWSDIIQEVDQNGDGEIDLKEFETLLLSKI